MISKEEFEPTHQTEFLGPLIDMTMMPLSLTLEKLIKVTEKSKILLHHPNNTV